MIVGIKGPAGDIGRLEKLEDRKSKCTVVDENNDHVSVDSLR